MEIDGAVTVKTCREYLFRLGRDVDFEFCPGTAMYKSGPRHHSNSHTSKQVPRARVDLGSPFRGESNFVHVLRDFRAHQPRRSCQHRLQVPKTALHKSPGVAELRSYRRRFNLREFFTELLVLCFQFCELHPYKIRQSHAGNRFRAVTNLLLDLLDTPTRSSACSWFVSMP